MNIGEANDKLVKLIDEAARKTVHLDDEARLHWEELIEGDIITRCMGLKLKPYPYIQYYHLKLYELEYGDKNTDL